MRMSEEQVRRLDAYWRAANYLTVGQIYLQDNPLLREPFCPEHIKPRLLGHWGTSPGLSFIYAHLNRLVKETDTSAIYLAGPGHGGPAIVANVYLEGTYSEIYPEISRDLDGMRRLFRQFSTPGGVPSHVSVPTPGSIHEGGELGYVLVHAFGAAFDNPDLLVAAVIGDGEAETGPLEGSWKGIHFLNPARDGAVLPILHLNGYKIAGPTVLGRSSDDEVASLLRGHGYEPRFVEGHEPMDMHARFAATLETCYAETRAIQQEARRDGRPARRPRWPAIVLRTPKGWTGPKIVDGQPVEGTFRAHQVPLPNVRENAEHLRLLEAWMKSYRPEELFDNEGRLVPAIAALVPKGDRRMGANPHANGGKLLVGLDLPDFTEYSIAVTRPGVARHESTRQLGKMMRDIFTRNARRRNFRLFCPDETNSNRLGDVFAVEKRCSMDTVLATDDHGFSHQGPGLIDVVLSKKGTVSRIYLPPDANCLLSVADHCFRSRNYVNLIVIDKQPQPQWLDMDAAREHCARGASIWRWASNDDGAEPDVVLAAAGDIPTMEVVAAAWWLRRRAPEMKVRVVNVVDLMTLFTPDAHPHGMDQTSFVELFGRHTDVVFAFHGYQRAIHEIVHGRPDTERFHVRGFNEEGTTTTPFDMVVKNGISRYHLCIEALRRAGRRLPQASELIEECRASLARHELYT